MNDLKKKRYKDCLREVKITEELKNEYGQVSGKEEFKLNADGKLLFSFIWDVNGVLVSAEENKYDDSSRIKNHYYKKSGESGRTEYFYSNKGLLIREKSTIENKITHDKMEIVFKYNSKGKLKHLKSVTTSYDEDNNIVDVDVYEEDEETGFSV